MANFPFNVDDLVLDQAMRSLSEGALVVLTPAVMVMLAFHNPSARSSLYDSSDERICRRPSKYRPVTPDSSGSVTRSARASADSCAVWTLGENNRRSSEIGM